MPGSGNEIGRGGSQMLNLRGLDRRSRKFAERLLTTYPQWRLLARTERAPGAPADHLIVEVAPPEPRDLTSPLWISTRGGVIVVAFDCNHGHFRWPPHHWRVDIWTNARSLVAAILNDDVAAASGWDEGGMRISSWVRRGEASWPRNPPPSVDRIRLRSWSGSLDRDFPFSPEADDL